MIDTTPYIVTPGSRIDLGSTPSDVDGAMKESDGDDALEELREEMAELQQKLYAGNGGALLIVLQAMDAAGKDSTIRHVFGHLNPQGCRVANFKAPSDLELRHDYLWRVHRYAPERGYIRIFNRSHYEDVLIVRVKSFVPAERWSRRYDHINAWERMLHDEGTTIVKIYLHISKSYQKKRFQRRLDRPDKHWKFNPADIEERANWKDYRAAYEEAFARCSTAHAPWYVIPAETRWFRNLLISQVIVNTMRRMNLRFPEPDFDPTTITIE